ncbi:hypothetical protein E4U25_008187, partial [Claviceps purpurea]
YAQNWDAAVLNKQQQQQQQRRSTTTRPAPRRDETSQRAPPPPTPANARIDGSKTHSKAIIIPAPHLSTFYGQVHNFFAPLSFLRPGPHFGH